MFSSILKRLVLSRVQKHAALHMAMRLLNQMKVNFIEVHCSLWVRKIKAEAREASVAFSDAEAAVIGANNLTFFCLKLQWKILRFQFNKHEKWRIIKPESKENEFNISSFYYVLISAFARIKIFLRSTKWLEGSIKINFLNTKLYQ